MPRNGGGIVNDTQQKVFSGDLAMAQPHRFFLGGLEGAACAIGEFIESVCHRSQFTPEGTRREVWVGEDDDPYNLRLTGEIR